MRLTTEDRERLALLVERFEMPATMVVRQLLRRTVEELGADVSAPPKKKVAASKRRAKR